jgi:anti-sigma regulatory factor (Ser/Thr protein kinase)
MGFAHNQSAFTLTVPGDSRSLSVVRGMMDAVCKLAGYDDQTRYEIVAAVNEACSNVITHAYGDKQQLPVTLECSVSDEGLEVRLRDEGHQFDFDAVPELDPTEVRNGGRGVYLIRRYLDDVSSAVSPDGTNELRMFKRTARSAG